MANIKVKMSDATEPQIREFAELTLGLDVTPSTPLDAVRSAIALAWEGPDILVRPPVVVDVMVGAPPPAVVGSQALSAASVPPTIQDVTGQRTQGGTGREDPRVKLMIPAQDSPGGKDDVNVGVNGVVWQLKRGVELDVPYRVYEALKLTEKTVITQITEGRNSWDEMSNVPAYPFHTLAMPSQEVVAAWRARTNDTVFPA